MKLRGTQKEEDAEVQMAPLIDCVFILLIFFLVTSMLQKPHNELLFDVPHAGAGDKVVEKEEPLVIVVTGKNPDEIARKQQEGVPTVQAHMLIGGQPVTKQLLDRQLRQVSQESPDRQIRIDSAGNLAWRHIVPVLDLCRFHNLRRVNVRTM
jgi:biopolymer transport protein ExbD